MTQYARPSSDLATTGWTATPLWSKIDDDLVSSPSGDGVEITSAQVGNGQSSSQTQCSLSSVADPGVNTGHVMRVRWRLDNARATFLNMALDEGAAQRASFQAQYGSTTETEHTYTLTTTEAGNITDYGNLSVRLWCTGNQGGPTRALVVDAFQFEVPDAPISGIAAPTQGDATASASGTFSFDAPTWDNYPGQDIIWGGTSGHPYTTTSTGTGATFNLNDTSTFALGDRSIRVTTAGTTQNDFVRVLGGPSMDFTDRVPQLWLKVDDPSRMLDVNLWLGSGGGLGSAYIWSLEDGVPHFYDPNGWVSLTLPWSLAQVTGTPNRAALTDLNLQIFDNGNVLNLWWGGLASIPDTTARFPNGVLSFTFDDGYLSTRSEAAPYLDSKGWAGTEFPIDEVIGTGGVYMSSAQLVELRETYVWEIGLHSHTSADHNTSGGFTSLSESQIQSNLSTQASFLTGLGLPDPTSFAYPQGAFDGPTAAAIRDIAGQARTTKGGHPDTVPAGDRAKVYCQPADAAVSVATITALIDDAVANGEWVVLLFHDIVSSGATGIEYNQADFETIVDYAETAGIAVLPFGEAQNALNVTGATAAAQAADTASASGSVAAPTVTGAAVVTQDTQTASSTGILGYQGSAAAGQADQTASGTGQLRYTGTSAVTQDAQASSIAGVLSYTGTVSQVQADQTASASGSEAPPAFTAVAAAVQADGTASAAGVLGYEGQADLVELDDTTATSGTTTDLVTGAAPPAQQPNTASAAGQLGYAGTVASGQASNAAAGSGLSAAAGTSSASQEDQTAAATGILGVSGSSAATQDAHTGSAVGTFGYVGAADLSQAANTAAAEALAGLIGIANPAQADQTPFAVGFLTVAGVISATQEDQTASASGVLPGLELVDITSTALAPVILSPAAMSPTLAAVDGLAPTILEHAAALGPEAPAPETGDPAVVRPATDPEATRPAEQPATVDHAGQPVIR